MFNACIQSQVKLFAGHSWKPIVGHWHLESPQSGDIVSPEGFLVVKGWALTTDPLLQSSLHIVFRYQGSTLSFPVNLSREDVVEHFFKAPTLGHPQLLSGFSQTVAALEAGSGFEIGFEVDGLIHPAAAITMG